MVCKYNRQEPLAITLIGKSPDHKQPRLSLINLKQVCNLYGKPVSGEPKSF
jgi:hypothetical protein